jgi:hypothetical protein
METPLIEIPKAQDAFDNILKNAEEGLKNSRQNLIGWVGIHNKLCPIGKAVKVIEDENGIQVIYDVKD